MASNTTYNPKRFRTYTDCINALQAKIGDTTLSTTLATWLNIALNERLSFAEKCDQWPDIYIWEQRLVDSTSHVAYNQHYGFYDIESCYFCSANSPYQSLSNITTTPGNAPYILVSPYSYANHSLIPINYLLDGTGIYVEYPNAMTGESSPNGITSYVWIKYLPHIKQRSGNAWSSSASYSPDTVVWDATSGDYYNSIYYSSVQAVSNTTCWQQVIASQTNLVSPNYSGSTSYSIGNVVFDNVSTYQWYQYIGGSATIGTALSNTSYWALLAPANADNGSALNMSTTYLQGSVVWDATSGNFFYAGFANGQGTNQAVSTSNLWTRLGIPRVIYDYVIHSTYAYYLQTYKQGDKANMTEQLAQELYLNPARDQLLKQNQKPIKRVINNMTQQPRRF